MNKAIDVAHYIIIRETKNGRPVSNLRLQKLLYFVQAQFFASRGLPCFGDTIEAWDFGPVIPVVYHRYKMYGGAAIPAIGLSTVNNPIPSNDRELIDIMLDECAGYSTSDLLSISCRQMPWKNAYLKPFDKRITQDSMRCYFPVSVK